MENQTYTVTCLDCHESISFDSTPELGDVLVCNGCGVELEITNTKPLEVNYLYVRK